MNYLIMANGEIAWHIETLHEILHYYFENNCIILGGDVLTTELEHNYDSWYFESNNMEPHEMNVRKSYLVAEDYISNYIRRNGKEYYVVVVIQ